MTILKAGAGLVLGLALGVFGASKFIDFIAYKAKDAADGWNVNYHLGNYGDDIMTRAIVARIGLGALPKEEALYFNANVGAGKQQLNGAHRYEMHFPAGELPDVKAFWSLTPYYAETELLVHNPINRFQIGDRADHLHYAADGSLTLYIQHEQPSDPVKLANWLPVPEGDFSLTLRAYEPGDRMLAGDYMPPLASKVGG